MQRGDNLLVLQRSHYSCKSLAWYLCCQDTVGYNGKDKALSCPTPFLLFLPLSSYLKFLSLRTG